MGLVWTLLVGTGAVVVAAIVVDVARARRRRTWGAPADRRHGEGHTSANLAMLHRGGLGADGGGGGD